MKFARSLVTASAWLARYVPKESTVIGRRIAPVKM